ncbi:MAG: CocE/NonD family hydrolase [Thermomicrobiales bacterium]
MSAEPRQTLHERFVANLTRETTDPWTKFETGIPMRDGIELAADVYLPKGQSGPFPTIVELTPYDKSGAFMIDDVGLFTRNGYAIVVVDLRGRGKSEGEWSPPLFDAPDSHDAVEWAAVQPWSTGKVGMTGLSYMGWVQWAAASEHPPHLAAMISTSAAGRWQQEIPYTDGCLQLYFGWWAYMVRRRITEFHGLETNDWEEILRWLPIEKIGEFINPAGPLWENMVGRDRLDDFWRAVRYDDQYDTFDIPVLHVTGWYDLEDLLGAFHHYEHMMAASPAKASQRLIVGPWSHVNSRMPHHSYAGDFLSDDAALDMDAEHVRWMDYWLKDEQNGALDTAPVRIYEPGSNRWREEQSWPLSTKEETFYLSFDGAAGSLASEEPPDDSPAQSYRYDPLDPVPTQIDIRKYPVEHVPLDQTGNEARSDVISYTSEVLTEPITISGWAHLKLNAASDCDDTDFHVKITDVRPDGRSMKVTQGCKRASYRNSLSEPTAIVPNEPFEIDIELWPTHHAFLPGHQIRVTVTSSDFPWFARNLNQFGHIRYQSEPKIATNTILPGSRIVLPVE